MAEINLKPLPPQKAIDFFEKKGFQFTWNWHEMWNDDHNKAFTVAKVTTLDILQDIRDAVTAALKEGTTFKEFADVLIPTLQSKGWWGKQEADGKTVQLGSPWRLETIFRTNIQSAFQVGHYRDMTSQEVKKARPFWEYAAVLDSRTRPPHMQWNGTILPHDDKWWDTHYPPNGWNSLLPNQRVSGKAHIGLKAWYSGPAVEIVGRTGGTLSLTAQHPVLTSNRGWVDAGSLKQTDKLVYYRDSISGGTMSTNTDKDDLPPTIEQVFKSFPPSLKAVFGKGAFNLYGDKEFFKSDIDVVFADRELMKCFIAEFRKLIDKNFFHMALIAFCDRAANSSLFKVRRDLFSSVGSFNAPLFYSISPMFLINGRNAVNLDSVSFKKYGNLFFAFMKFFSNIIERHSGLIHSNDFLGHLLSSPEIFLRSLDFHSIHFGSHFDTGILNYPVDCGATNSEAFSDISTSHTRFINIDDITDIRRFNYTGHVYDLQTVTNNILAYGGIKDNHYIVSNCRCTVTTLSQREMDRRGLKVTKRPNLNSKEWTNPSTGKVERVPEGIDPGFAFNPGKKEFKPGTRQYDPDIRKLFNS